MTKPSLMLIAAVLALFASVSGFAAIYQYVDENGTVNFTDDPGKIPEKYWDQKKSRQGGDPRSPVMRVRIENNQVLVPVTVVYRGTEVQATFLLDTGATTCTISPDLASRLKINPQETDMGLAQVAGGGVLLVGSTKVDYLIVGPNTVPNVEVGVIPSGSNDGLLGMNFLRHFRYRINFDEHTIHWGG